VYLQKPRGRRGGKGPGGGANVSLSFYRWDEEKEARKVKQKVSSRGEGNLRRGGEEGTGPEWKKLQKQEKESPSDFVPTWSKKRIQKTVLEKDAPQIKGKIRKNQRKKLTSRFRCGRSGKECNSNRSS